MTVVADAGPLIHLSWVDRLSLLSDLFGPVLVPHVVREEVLSADPIVAGVPALQHAFATGRIVPRRVENVGAAHELRRRLDRGESEAIMLAVESAAELLLVDDRTARLVAEERGLRVMGTLGILRMGRDRGLIESVVPIVEDLHRRGMYISDVLMDAVRAEEAGR